MTAQEYPFTPTWPEPEARFLRPELPTPPALPLAEVFGPIWSAWIKRAAEAKAAPPVYVAAGLLSVAGATIGNTRWASPWAGWAEPPIIWAMAIGTPSMNKSPGFDAVLSPLRKLESEARKRVEAEVSDWKDRAEVAKIAEAAWKEGVKAAMKDGKEVPSKPNSASPGPEPIRPRYAVTDATVEKLGVILASQPRGVLGGIQPDKLKSLLFKADDDGLLARFLPVWPHPAPIKRPTSGSDDSFLSAALERLIALKMPANDDGTLRPWFVLFDEDAAALFQEYRETVRGWETGAEGLLLSFTGKLPGLAVRLSLILAYLDYAADGGEQPSAIGVNHFGRAAHFVEAYVLPMPRRACADASIPKEERAARRLVSIIRDMGLERFTSREILQLERNGLRVKADLDPALVALEEANISRKIEEPPRPKGGAISPNASDMAARARSGMASRGLGNR